jgi:hypothetical protein
MDVRAGGQQSVCINPASTESYFTGTDDNGNNYQTGVCGPVANTMGVELDTTPGPDQNKVVCYIKD